MFLLKDGKKLFKEIKKRDLEGIVAKEKNSLYEIDTRSKKWIKIKNFKKESFYIGGYFYNESSHVFSVVLGEYKKDKLMFVGKAFIAKKNKLFETLKKERKVKSKFYDFNENNVNYITPKHKCNIKYIERTRNNHLRSPFYTNK